MDKNTIRVQTDGLGQCSNSLNKTKMNVIEIKNNLKMIRNDLSAQWSGPAGSAFIDRIPQTLERGDKALVTISSLQTKLNEIIKIYSEAESANIKSVKATSEKASTSLKAGDLFSD